MPPQGRGENQHMREPLRVVWSNPYVKVFVGLAIVYGVGRLFVAVQPAGTLLLTALGIAYLLNPAVDWLQARRTPRAAGVALVALFLVLLSGVMTWFSVAALRNTLRAADNGVVLTEAASLFFEELPAAIGRLLPGSVTVALNRAGETLNPMVQNLGERLYGLVSGAVVGVGMAFFVLVLTVYVLYDFHRISASLLRVWPEPYQAGISALAKTMDEVAGGYIRGQLLIALAVGIMVYVGLLLIGLPSAAFIAILAGALNIVPFLGTIVPVIPAVLLAAPQGWLYVILVLLVFTIANQIDNHLLTPQILSRSTSIHPVTVILAVIGGFAFGGLLAAILAVPVIAFAKVLYEEYYLKGRLHIEG
jgi:predicted PurR-regulated permease PerM